MTECSFTGCTRPRRVISTGLCSGHQKIYNRGEQLRPLASRDGAKLSCVVDGCDSPRLCKGMCQLHYDRDRKGYSPAVRRDPVCSLDGCNEPHKALGLCSWHYYRSTRDEPLDLPKKRISTGCNVDGCFRKHYAFGMCTYHRGQVLRYGAVRSIDPKPRKTRVTVTGGYVKIDCPEHPRRDKSGRVLEHIVVMETLLGRYLTEGENVHHRNGVRDDNSTDGPLRADPETGRLYSGNLELWSTSQPAGQRPGDKVKWAREIIKQYGEHFPEEQND